MLLSRLLTCARAPILARRVSSRSRASHLQYFVEALQACNDGGGEQGAAMVNFRIILSYTLNLFFGLLYPTWKSVEAVESKSHVDDAQWLSYWIIYTLLLIIETLLWPALKWLPLYGELKALLLAWLVLPHTKGATYLYEKYVGPGFHKLKAEARKVPALQKLLDGDGPKAN